MFPSGINPAEFMLFAMIALLLFGKKLPEVARSMGKGVMEFKKGMKGFEDEMRGAVSDSKPIAKTPVRRPEAADDQQKWTAARFDPPTSEPQTVGSDSTASSRSVSRRICCA